MLGAVSQIFRSCSAALLCVALLAGSAGADECEARYRRAVALGQAEDFTGLIRELDHSCTEERPLWLLLIAKAHARLGATEKALEFGRRFLCRGQGSPAELQAARALVDRTRGALRAARLEAAEALLRQRRALEARRLLDPAGQPGQAEATPACAGPPPLDAEADRREASLRERIELALRVVPPPPPREVPIHKRTWFRGVMGAGAGVVVVTAVVLGVVLGRGGDTGLRLDQVPSYNVQ